MKRLLAAMRSRARTRRTGIGVMTFVFRIRALLRIAANGSQRFTSPRARPSTDPLAVEYDRRLAPKFANSCAT